jgi:hypothetical protein
MRVPFALLLSACLLLAADSFSGKWSSSQNDAEGTIDIQLAEPAVVTFTLRGQEVKTKVLALKKEASGIQMRYEFDLDGARLISTLTGKITGDKFEGKYQTTQAGGDGVVDNGTFTAAAK